jgi:ribosome-binding protein aMBF1 (putative translation factor)
MDGQDWKNIIWDKRTHQMKPSTTRVDKTLKKWNRLDDNEGECKPRNKKMKNHISFGKFITKNRIASDMTRSDLAKRLNIPILKLRNIEIGEEGASDKIRSDMQRIFKN